MQKKYYVVKKEEKLVFLKHGKNAKIKFTAFQTLNLKVLKQKKKPWLF